MFQQNRPKADMSFCMALFGIGPGKPFGEGRRPGRPARCQRRYRREDDAPGSVVRDVTEKVALLVGEGHEAVREGSPTRVVSEDDSDAVLQQAG